VTIELIESIQAKGHATVELFVTRNADGVPLEFLIVTSSAYRATLPACPCDREDCMLKSCRNRAHCHPGTHELTARARAAAVAKTYGSAKRPETKILPRRGPSSKMSDREWAAARGEISWDEAYS
jgi:hypothetical protein